MVENTRVAQLALGEPVIGPKQAEQNVLRFRRSLYVTQDVKAGIPSPPKTSAPSAQPAASPPTPTPKSRPPLRTDAKAGTPLTWDLL